jgi:hypothetical protein
MYLKGRRQYMKRGLFLIRKKRNHIMRFMGGAAALILSLIITACGGESGPVLPSYAQVIFRFYRSGTGDAKLLDDNYLLTVKNRNLVGIDLTTGDVTKYDIYADWLDIDRESRTIIYSNADFELGAARFDENEKIIHNEIIYLNNQSDYMIDPAVEKIGDTYYISMTFVDGKLNNDNTEKNSGKYTIRFYSSTDLKSLTFLSEVVSAKRNLEDVKLIADGEELYMVFEKETVDKGNSAILLTKSGDLGKTWSTPAILLDSTADHEPAGFIRTEEGWELYYSMDQENPGESYNGSSAFRTRLNDKMEILETDEKVILAKEADESTDLSEEYLQKGGILLYDAEKFGDDIYFVYAENYLTDNNLCVSVLEQ